MVNPRGGIHTLFWQEDSWEVSYELVVSHCMRIDCLASTSEDSKQDLKSAKEKCRQRVKWYSCNPKTFSGDKYFYETDELRDVSPQNGRWHTQKNVSHKEGGDTQTEYTHSVYGKVIHTLCCRIWIKHEINILLQKLDWWRKTKSKEENHIIFFTNNDADEA